MIDRGRRIRGHRVLIGVDRRCRSSRTAKSPLTLKVAKEAVRAAHRLPIEEGLLYERDLFCLCFSTQDKQEGVAAFLEKRPAQWTGR